MDITALINASGLTREEICAKAGISRASLSMIERGKRNPGPDAAERLAKTLGVSPGQIRPDLAALAGRFSTGSAA